MAINEAQLLSEFQKGEHQNREAVEISEGLCRLVLFTKRPWANPTKPCLSSADSSSVRTTPNSSPETTPRTSSGLTTSSISSSPKSAKKKVSISPALPTSVPVKFSLASELVLREQDSKHIRSISKYAPVSHMIMSDLRDKFGRDSTKSDSWVAKSEEFSFLDELYMQIKDCYQQLYDQENLEYSELFNRKVVKLTCQREFDGIKFLYNVTKPRPYEDYLSDSSVSSTSSAFTSYSYRGRY